MAHILGLEFDDSEIEKKLNNEEEIAQSDVDVVDPIDLDGIYLSSPDDLIEENFEEAFLSMATINCDELDDFDDVSKYGIVEVAGDDMFARKVITIYACRLPSNKTFNHHRFLRLEGSLITDSQITLIHY